MSSTPSRSWHTVVPMIPFLSQDSSPFQCLSNYSLFITSRCRIAVPQYCFLCPQGDETVTVDWFCMDPFPCVPVTDSGWVQATVNELSEMLSENLPKTNRGTGTRPLRYPALTSVASCGTFSVLCVDAFQVQELALSPGGSSSFGQLSLLDDASPPWADISPPKAVAHLFFPAFGTHGRGSPFLPSHQLI